MTNPKTSKIDRILHCQRIIAGLRKQFPRATIRLDGKAYATKEVIAMFEAYLAALTAVERAFQAWRLATDHATRMYFGQIRELLGHVRTFLDTQFGGPRSGRLREFGYAPHKVPYRSAKTKVAAAEKARATRAARGTMGRRQRAKIRASQS